MLKRCYFKIQ